MIWAHLFQVEQAVTESNLLLKMVLVTSSTRNLFASKAGQVRSPDLPTWSL